VATNTVAATATTARVIPPVQAAIRSTRRPRFGFGAAVVVEEEVVVGRVRERAVIVYSLVRGDGSGGVEGRVVCPAYSGDMARHNRPVGLFCGRS
jgi:hypothetical protein